MTRTRLRASPVFNEVFFNDARVPLANVVLGLNRGWAVARTTLANESAMIGSGASRGDGVEQIVALARARHARRSRAAPGPRRGLDR